jgi:hypothetical protein
MQKIKYLKILMPLSFFLTCSAAWAATPFLNLHCVSKELDVSIATDEAEQQWVVLSRLENSQTVGQAIYYNFKKNEALAVVTDFKRKIFTVNLGISGEISSVSTSVFQLIAIPGSMVTTGSTVKKSNFKAVIPEYSTYMPIANSEPMQNANPFDGKHRSNQHEIEMTCKLEMIQ